MRLYTPISLFFLLITFAACSGGNSASSKPTTQTHDLTKGQEIAEKQMENFQAQTTNRDVHDKETLKAMLPEEIFELTRQKISANAVSTGGFNMATAEASYYAEGDRSRRFDIIISDGVGAQATGMAANFSMDREEGGKRSYTTTIDGQKAFVEYEKGTNRGSLSVLHPQSIVKIEARQLKDEDELKKVYRALSLGKL
ncbi:MAG: hypothetical protein AAFU67_00660 [Bacteroidota bacterium]